MSTMIVFLSICYLEFVVLLYSYVGVQINGNKDNF